MKRLFILCILFFWGMGVVLPYVTGFLFDIFNTGLYGYVPELYLHKSALILTISVLVSLFIIIRLPVGMGYIEPQYNIGEGYIIVLFVIYGLNRLKLGGGSISRAFEATINGGYSGTLVAYFGLFFELTQVFFLYFLCVKRKVNYYLITALYIIYTILCASRSGLLTVFFILVVVLFTSEFFKEHRKKIITALIACVVIAPIIFVFSTANRRASAGWNIESIMNTVVGRISQLELSGTALYKSENNLWNEEIFEKKYDVIRQAELIVNSTIPGDIFKDDVDPNQYFRSAFLGTSEWAARNNYTSMNITLPIYLSLKYGEIFGVLFTVTIVVSWFIMCCCIKNQALKILLSCTLDTPSLSYIRQIK